MRGMFGLVGLVVALVLVGLLVKKQLASTRAPMPALQTIPGSSPPGTASSDTVRAQSQQIQKQVQQQVEGLMQQARPMPEEDK